MLNFSSSPGAPDSIATADARVVSVIIPTFDGIRFLDACLSSLLSQEITEFRLEVLLIDNGSQDGSAEFVRKQFPSVQIVANATNIGFTRAINQGLQAARGAWILLLNNDTVMRADALGTLLTTLQQSPPEVGGVQPLLLWIGDSAIVDSAGIVLGKRFGAHDHLHGQSVQLVPNGLAEIWGVCFACALIRREVFERAGGLDPDFFAEWDDVDFATRARWVGYRFLLAPGATVLHHRSPTSQRDSRAKFVRLRRNRLLTFLKCLPRGMAIRLILYRLQRDVGMVVHFAHNRQLIAVISSWQGVIKLMPRMLSRRKEWRREAQLSNRQMVSEVQRAMNDA